MTPDDLPPETPASPSLHTPFGAGRLCARPGDPRLWWLDAPAAGLLTTDGGTAAADPPTPAPVPAPRL